MARQPATEIALEACGGSHHWERVLTQMGHGVQLIPPQYVKPFVKRGKNDRNDAEAICEAARGRVPTSTTGTSRTTAESRTASDACTGSRATDAAQCVSGEHGELQDLRRSRRRQNRAVFASLRRFRFATGAQIGLGIMQNM